MNNNIFEGVKFGDKFLTRNGRIAIYVCQSMDFIGTIAPLNTVNCIIEGHFYLTVYNYDGTIGNKYPKEYEMFNIVSKYHEPIVEEKLDELAINECAELLKNDILYYEAGDECVECVVLSNAEECYKIGYRKAKEE